MKCPADETELAMTDRQGIEIDYCPKCRGVWLDRGELDKLIERSGAAATLSPTNVSDTQGEQHQYRGSRRDDDNREHGSEYDGRNSQQYGSGKKKKKDGFLGDLFDF